MELGGIPLSMAEEIYELDEPHSGIRISWVSTNPRSLGLNVENMAGTSAITRVMSEETIRDFARRLKRHLLDHCEPPAVTQDDLRTLLHNVLDDVHSCDMSSSLRKSIEKALKP